MYITNHHLRSSPTSRPSPPACTVAASLSRSPTIVIISMQVLEEGARRHREVRAPPARCTSACCSPCGDGGCSRRSYGYCRSPPKFTVQDVVSAGAAGGDSEEGFTVHLRRETLYMDHWYSITFKNDDGVAAPPPLS
ncbi:unnamed protein product [Urochloa humidicola]